MSQRLATLVTGEIRYVTHNGSGPRTSFNPSWSPDGKRIAFTDALFPQDGPAIGDIWTVRPDGSGRQQVSRSPRFEFRPDWAPDSRQIWAAGRPGASPARPVVSGPAFPGPAH